MFFHKKGASLLTLVILIGLVLSACATPTVAPPAAEPAPTEAPAEPKVLIMGVEGSAPTFDPLAASDSRVDTPSLNMYSSLIQVKPGTTETELDLAESYELGDDGLTYTFTLRKGVKFHDGSELKAEDVKYTVDRMLAIKKGVYRSLTSVVGSEVIDDYTVTITTGEPFPGLAQALARLYVLNSEVVKANEEEGDWGEKWLENHEAGSGPYTLVSFEPEQQFTMEAFPDYHKGWEGAHADKVIFRVLKEVSTRRLALENGDVDWITVGSADSYEALKSVDGVKVYADATLNELYFAFNTQIEPLDDARVRKALSLAYDYQGHVEQARNGFADIARGPLPASIPCFDESMEPSKMDLEEAKSLLADAGYPDGGFELEMIYQGTMAEETVAVQIMADGAAQLGVTIKPLAMEWPAKVAAYSSLDTATGMGTIWIYPSYPDPDQYLFRLAHSSQAGNEGLNFAYYSNPRMDELLVAGQSELDPEKRCELYREAQQIWVEDTPYANVVIGWALAASRDYVEGYVWTPSHSFAQNVYIMSVEGK
ncbi:MAG: ABC transporter substrate-binding protein [Anaerolineae bacterium]|nr:ABC transporter substrate-binding protein [Anaerolineae bacterium]